jgi:putative membrane protein
MSDEPPVAALPFRRLHPATVLVEIVRKLGSMLYLIIIALVVRLFGGEGDWFEYFITVVVGLSGGLSLARYISLRYGLEGDRLVIRSGIFRRQIRTIPIDKIQNINLKRNVLHRLLRVVDVKIETAVAGQTEAELSVLGEADAQALRGELLRRKPAAAPEEPPVEEAAETWSTTHKDLLIVGATENRAGVIVASIAGLYYTFLQDLGEKVWKPVEGYLKGLLGTSLDTAILVAVLGVVLLIVAGWIVSIALTIVGYYGFTLRRAEDRLRRRYGLFTQVETVVPLRRIQVLRLESPILRRLWGFFTVYAETAGSVSDRKSGGSTPLGPLVKGRDAARFCRLAFPDLDLDRVEWRPVSRLTIRRGFLRAAFILLALAGAVAGADRLAADPGMGADAWLGAKLLWTIPVALALAFWWAWVRYRVLAYAEVGSFVLGRSGIWTRKIWVVPKGKVQSISAQQSPFQRRLGLANLSIDTAGSRLLGGAQVVDLPYETAVTLQDNLSQTANAEGLWLPDGV